MQRVINGLLYDTKNATVVHTDKNNNRVLYVTENNNFFMLYSNGEIVPKTEQSTKDYLGKHNVKKYIELFGNPKEA